MFEKKKKCAIKLIKIFKVDVQVVVSFFFFFFNFRANNFLFIYDEHINSTFGTKQLPD